MSAGGKPLGDLIHVWSEKLLTDTSLGLDQIKRWAISVPNSRILVLTREQETISTKFGGGFDRVRVCAQVFNQDRNRLDSKSWKAQELSNDLLAAFGSNLSLEIELNF